MSLYRPRLSGGSSSAIATMIASEASLCEIRSPVGRFCGTMKGFPNRTLTGTRRGHHLPFGRHSRVPVTATGRTAQPAFWAMKPAPGSGALRTPDSTRVPSGYMTST